MGAAEHRPTPPDELRAVDQWIVVLLVPLPNGKTDKLPIDYRTASVTAKGGEGAHDPAIWTTYQHAATLAHQWGPQFTVGFVLTENDDFWCLDIDSCAAPGSQSGWSDFAIELCMALPQTVVEVSQSGRGLHVWGRGRLPPHAKKRVDLGIELYSERRFIAIGHSWIGDMSQPCPTIAQFAAQWFPPKLGADAIVPDKGPRADWRGPRDDGVLIERAMRAKGAASRFGSRASFADLWTRNVEALARTYRADPGSTDPYDESSADLALASHLAYWTGCDVLRIERLMRRSSLAREKYGRHDYLIDRTIMTACRTKHEVLQDPPTADDVLAKLRELDTPSEITAAWLPLTVPLSAVDRELVVDYLSRCLPLGPQALKRELKRADEAAQRQRRTDELKARVADRELIHYRPDAQSEVAAACEAAIVASARPGEYVSFGGVLSHVTTKPLPNTHLIDRPDEAPPSVPQLEPLDSVAMLQRVEAVAVLCETKRDGTPVPIAVPERVLEILVKKKVHAAPVVNGLVTHPLVLRDGSILASSGLHEPSRLFLYGATPTGARPYTQSEAVAALARLRSVFLDGFEFASPLDADVALAGLLTGVQRRVLESAPGLAVLASTQSSGKTTLARRVHLILTGRDMPVSSFALGDEAEASKRLLSALLRSPAMIVFDNVQDGFTFASGSLAAAMTSSSIEQRVLGISRDATAPTTVLFVITGNNLTLGNDEVTRWLVTRLAPASARPQERRFRHPDVVGHALSIRAAVLRDVVGIVAGYLASGASISSGSRFATWDRMVRQPLLWAGALDVADVFRDNAEQSEPVKALRGMLWALTRLFGTRWFKAADVASAACAPGDPNTTLRWALESLAVRHIEKSRSVGRALQANLGRVADIDGVVVRLEKEQDSHVKMDQYRVSAAGFGGI